MISNSRLQVTLLSFLFICFLFYSPGGISTLARRIAPSARGWHVLFIRMVKVIILIHCMFGISLRIVERSLPRFVTKLMYLLICQWHIVIFFPIHKKIHKIITSGRRFCFHSCLFVCLWMRNQFLRNFVQRIFIGVRDKGRGGNCAPKILEKHGNSGKCWQKLGRFIRK